jgi:uncharacterized membrane protein YjjP (DUF1212 family)
MVLEAGGETYRAEEVVVALCGAWGMEDAECFATPTGLMASVSDSSGASRGAVRRVARRSVDLRRVSRLVQVIDKERRSPRGPGEFSLVLEAVVRERPYRTAVVFAAAGASAGLFALLFGGSPRDAAAAFLVGLGIKAIQLAGASRRFPDFITNSVGGAVTAALSAAAVAAGLAENLDKTVIGSIMLLVPGLSTVNAIRDTIAGDLVAGVARLADAFMAAAAISLGAGFAFSIASMISRAMP